MTHGSYDVYERLTNYTRLEKPKIAFVILMRLVAIAHCLTPLRKTAGIVSLTCRRLALHACFMIPSPCAERRCILDLSSLGLLPLLQTWHRHLGTNAVAWRESRPSTYP